MTRPRPKRGMIPVPAHMRAGSDNANQGGGGLPSIESILGDAFVAAFLPDSIASSGDGTAMTSWPSTGGGHSLAPPGTAPTHYTGEYGPRNVGHISSASAAEVYESTGAGFGDLLAGATCPAFSLAIVYRCNVNTINRAIAGWGSTAGTTNGAAFYLRTRTVGHSLIWTPDDTGSNVTQEPITGVTNDDLEHALIISFAGPGAQLRIDHWTPSDGWSTAVDNATFALAGAFTSIDVFAVGGVHLGGSASIGSAGLKTSLLAVGNAALDAAQFTALRAFISARHGDTVSHILTTRTQVINSATATHGSVGDPGGDGSNIMHPSVVRLEHSGAANTYGLLFGHHDGTYIRRAVSDAIASGWAVQAAGTDMSLATLEAAIGGGTGFTTGDHLSSPHVWWDSVAELYYCMVHGTHANAGFSHDSAIASSPDFAAWTWLNSGAAVNGNTTGLYMRPFKVGAAWYAFGTTALELYKSTDASGLDGYERISNYETIKAAIDASGDVVRHCDAVVRGDTLVVFYSNKGGYRERIRYCTIDISGADSGWVASAPADFIYVYTTEDGADRPYVIGSGGEVADRERQLRDPHVFTDSDDSVYLYYAQAGEDAIGVVDITSWIDSNFPVA